MKRAIRIFASIIVLSSIWHIFAWSFVLKSPHTAFAGFSENDTLNYVLCGLFVLLLVLSAVGGIGILFLKNWSRILMIVTASLIIPAALYEMAAGGFFSYLLDTVNNFEGFKIAFMITVVFDGIGFLLPFVIFYFTRSKVKAEFK